MANLILGSRAAVLLVLLACGCGGSSENTGGAGAGGSGGRGLPGASGAPGTSGASAGGNSNGASGSNAAGSSNSGGSSSSGSCRATSACGGNVVGDWKIQEMCVESELSQALATSCPDASLRVTVSSATGTISFKADNTMSSTAVISVDEAIHFPATCATVDQCTAFESQLASTAGVMNSHCNYSEANGCSCSLSSTQPTMSAGTYQVQGSNLSITNAASGNTEVDSFCVSGNTMTVFQNSASNVAVMTLTK